MINGVYFNLIKNGKKVQDFIDNKGCILFGKKPKSIKEYQTNKELETGLIVSHTK